MTKAAAMLAMNSLKLDVKLGVPHEERTKEQPVQVDIRFYFNQSPDWAMDDGCQDYICYDKLSQVIAEYVRDMEFHFIEFLTMQLHRVVREHISAEISQEAEDVSVWVRVRKAQLPAPCQLQHVEFSYSDHPDITGL